MQVSIACCTLASRVPTRISIESLMRLRRLRRRRYQTAEENSDGSLGRRLHRKTLHGFIEQKYVNCCSRFSYLHFNPRCRSSPMPSYDSFMCPNCEDHFRVIWPEPLPSHYHLCSKIKIKCPDCQEVTELYDFLIDRIMQPPDASIPNVEVLSISPRDPNPDPNARSNYWHKVWSCREARYRTMYRPVK